MLDMGIDPFLLSTSLVGVLSQRLLRVLCPICKTQARPTDEEREVLRSVFRAGTIESIFHPTGCDACFGTGYRGRMAIHELMPVTAEISKMIASRQPVESIRETAASYGYRTMQEDSLRRILEGVTSVQEAKRLVAFDTIERHERRSHPGLLAA